MLDRLTPALLLRAYAMGIFPMADGPGPDAIGWYDPPHRGILPLDGFHVPRSLAKIARRGRYRLTVDRAFETVMRACAEPTPDRPDTWINDTLVAIYTQTHEIGHAHSVEVWDEDRLVGGLYGVSLGAAFFGESMFSRVPNASKLALVHLVDRLKAADYRLLDTQFTNPHLLQFGCVEIPRAAYHRLLRDALDYGPRTFNPTDDA